MYDDEYSTDTVTLDTLLDALSADTKYKTIAGAFVSFYRDIFFLLTEDGRPLKLGLTVIETWEGFVYTLGMTKSSKSTINKVSQLLEAAEKKTEVCVEIFKGRKPRGYKKPNAKPSKICTHVGCKERAAWAFKEDSNSGCSVSTGVCEEHKFAGMVNVGEVRSRRQKICVVSGCAEAAEFRFDGEKDYTRCDLHKLHGMMHYSKVSRCCEFLNCTKVPTFNYPGEKKRRFCGEHKLPNMVNVENKSCEHDECFKQATFNFPNAVPRRGVYCGNHKLPGMVHVKGRKCAAAGCSKRPAFCAPLIAAPGSGGGAGGGAHEAAPSVCAAHATAAHRPWAPPACAAPACGKPAAANNAGAPLAGGWCRGHRRQLAPAAAQRARTPRCQAEGCARAPSFAAPGARAPAYCGAHRRPGDHNVRARRCAGATPGGGPCPRRPTWNLGHRRTGRFCAAHAREGMVDLARPRCAAPACGGEPAFNYAGEVRGLLCAQHRRPEMVTVGATLAAAAAAAAASEGEGRRRRGRGRPALASLIDV